MVGGGPAGLEAARTLAGRGHEVVLFEKTSQLGGLLKGIVRSPMKADLKRYLDWSMHTAMNCKNINLRMDTEATPALLDEENPDALILATGGTPVIPRLTYRDESKVIWVGDINNSNVRIGGNVLIAGAGLTGCEAALQFLRAGKKVTLIDILPKEDLGSGSSPINAYAFFNMLEEYNPDLRTRTKLVDVTQDYAIVAKDGTEERLAFDTIVLSLGTRVDVGKINHLRTAVPECYVAGTCNGKSGTVWNAVTSAFDAAMAI